MTVGNKVPATVLNLSNSFALFAYPRFEFAYPRFDRISPVFYSDILLDFIL